MRLTALAVLAAVALPLALPAPARADAGAVLAGAQHLDALEPFLTRYLGRCTDVFEKRTCEANTAQARRELTGKTFAVTVTDAAPLVRTERRGDGYVVLLTPFIDGGGLALTHGAPAKQDARGRPLIAFIPITVQLPAGMMEMEFESPFRTGAITVEIAFRPEKPWKLARKGEGLYEGVAAKFLAVRVVNARTGQEIASKVL